MACILAYNYQQNVFEMEYHSGQQGYVNFNNVQANTGDYGQGCSTTSQKSDMESRSASVVSDESSYFEDGNALDKLSSLDCPSCTIQRCFDIAFSAHLNSESVANSKIKQEIFDLESTLRPLRECQQTLRCLTQIHLEFKGQFTLQSVWGVWMEHQRKTTYVCAKFVKNIPGYSLLPMEDRKTLFKLAVIPLALTQATQPNSTAASPFFGLSNQAKSALFYYFPTLQVLESRAHEIQAAMKEWSPSTDEFVILQALLFYQYGSMKNFQRQDIVYSQQELMLNSLKLVMKSAYQERWPLFEKTYHLLTGISQISANFIDSLSTYPEPLTVDHLFQEMSS